MRIGSYERKVLDVILSRGGEVLLSETSTTRDGICILPWRHKSGRGGRDGYSDASYHYRVVARMVVKGLLVWTNAETGRQPQLKIMSGTEGDKPVDPATNDYLLKKRPGGW